MQTLLTMPVGADNNKKTGQAERIIELEDSIKFDCFKIADNKTKIKEAQKKLKIALEADSGYNSLTVDIKQKQKERKEVKKKLIDASLDLAKLDSDVKGMRTDNRMRQLTLSDALIEYEGLTGQLTIPGIIEDLKFEKVIRIKKGI